MQRKPSKNTRGPNADEKAFMAWVKEQPCCVCEEDGPSIVDHMYGSAFKHNKVLIGMWALLPYCWKCDQVKTELGRYRHDTQFKKTQAELWNPISINYFMDTGKNVPTDVAIAIKDWGR